MIVQQSITQGDPTGLPASALYFLRTFHTVATHRGFTRAGRALHLGQPAVSAQIRALERHYGAPLFQLRRRRVHLTAEGEALLAYTQRVFNLLRDAEQAVAAVRAVDGGRLALAASATVGVYLLGPVLRRFARAHPSVAVEVAIGTTAEVLGHLLADRVPFGLVEAPVSHPGLEVHPFAEDELVLVAPPDHPLAGGAELPLDALRGLPLLRREAGSGTRAFVDVGLERAGVAVRTAMVLGSTEALKQAVLAGLGVAWVPRIAVGRELAAGELAHVALAGFRLHRTLSLVRPRGLRLPPAADAFLALLGGPLTPRPAPAAARAR